MLSEALYILTGKGGKVQGSRSEQVEPPKMQAEKDVRDVDVKECL